MNLSFRRGALFALCGALVLQLAPAAAWAQDRMRRPPMRDESIVQTFLRANTPDVPAGTVIFLHMQTELSSKRARPGDLFRARVSTPVQDRAGRTLVPAGSLVAGHVEAVEPAKSRRRSGIIAVGFDTLTTPDGAEYPLSGTLAPATAEDRKRFDEEGQVHGNGSHTQRSVAFIGGGAGVGAIVGAIGGGALLGAGVGAAVGVFAALLAKGKEATVEPGDRFGIALEKPLNIAAAPVSAPPSSQLDSYPGGSGVSNPPPRPLPSPTPRPRDWYDTTTNVPIPPPRTGAGAGTATSGGTATPPPRTGAGAGTAASGGTATPPHVGPTPRTNPPASGNTTKPTTPGTPPARVETGGTQLVNFINVLTERGSDGTVSVSITAQLPTQGWKLQPIRSQDRDTLLIQVRGVPPQGMAAQVISRQNTVIRVSDPDRAIQKVTVRGLNLTRTFVPLTRGDNPGGGASNAPSTTTGSAPGGPASGTTGSPASGASNPNTTQLSTRIADKLEALVDEYAQWMRAFRRPDGSFSFEQPSDAGTPEALMLFALHRLNQTAATFRGALTPEVQQRTVRDLSLGAQQVNRQVPFVKVPVDLMNRWKTINQEIMQLAGTAPTSASSGRARQ